MQDCLSRFERADDILGSDIDNLHGVVLRIRKVNPYLATVGTRHDEHGLAVNANPGKLLPVLTIYYQYLMPSDGRHKHVIACYRPALEVRHLVHGQFAFTAAVSVQNPLNTCIKVP